ncbi:hypothetical protein [Ketobacter sp.]|uniref:hypothetical protein n=1 Tax=Ketobacter sp. TaxID=2083498 RepID=UPI000F0E8E8A|nr:hypothetical protein [Ketobacter sp.]RLU00342.1 MAG: hypothetical protein D9N14_07580 [Ketobacter sp.]
MSDELWDAIQSTAEALIRQEHLPDDFLTTVADYFYPLALRLRDLQHARGRPVIIGVNGAQGTGKSTLALFLETLLNQHLDCPCARFSLDDIYLTRAEREANAKAIHPLLLTRGVPGTHDVALGNRVIDELLAAGPDNVVPIPAFDKARDDRAPMADWPLHRGSVSIILLEGWCVAALPEADPQQLQTPVNTLEAQEDPDGHWRRFVNQQLAEPYQRLFGRLDYLVMLKAPSMECILEWRTLQEQKLAEKTAMHQNGASAAGIMSPQQIKRFIMHYERLTRVMLAEMPQRADSLYVIDEQHRIKGVQHRD